MECRQCASPLERPGDYCLVCHTVNADSVVIAIERDRATLTFIHDDDTLGETTITTIPEDGDAAIIELRNFAGRIADEVQRKRPETVYVAGDREVISTLRGELHYEFFRVPNDDPVAAALDRHGGRAPEVVELTPAEKIGGRHSTLIGGRAGKKAIKTVASHPHVKKLIPGPIENGSTAEGGLRAKATRADGNGNVRMLLRDGATVQENRVVTTAMDRETGERVRADLNEALAEAELQ